MEHATPAQTVGNQFVSQYYTVLHSSPKHLHRFYSDRSTLTYADVIPEGDTITQNLKTATGQKMIHETVMNLGYEDIMTEIYSVDSQYSKDGGVVVQVTGALQAKGSAKRPFVQTFFLAVQEKGYYVLNDIFRYLLPPGIDTGGSASKETAAALAAAAAAAAQEASPSPGSSAGTVSPIIKEGEAHVEWQEPGATAAMTAAVPPPAGDPVVITAPPPLPAARSNGANVPAVVHMAYGAPTCVPVVVQVPVEAPPPAVAAAGPVVDAHAAAVAAAARAQQGSPASTSSAEHPHPPSPHVVLPPPAAIPSVPSPHVSTPAQRQAGHEFPAGGDMFEPPLSEGVFIRDIPHGVTVDQLAEALAAFGPITPGSLSLKSQKGRDSYAFVDFQSADSAAACLAAGIEMEGRRLTTEPKRPLIFRHSGPGGGRGGPPHMGGQHHYSGGGGRGGRGRYDGGMGRDGIVMGGGGRGGGMMSRGPPHSSPPGAYPAMAYPGGHVMMIPQRMAMPMGMPQAMMESAAAYGMAPTQMAGGGSAPRSMGGGRYDERSNNRGRDSRSGGSRGSGGPPPPPLQQQHQASQ